MALTPEQVRELKDQLRQQVANMPEPQKSQALKQIDELSDGALEEMIKQQQAQQGGAQGGGPQKGIFRMIVDGDVPSRKVNENKDAIAVISVKAVSKGHVLIIPKKPVGDANSIPTGAFGLARQVAKKIDSKLSPKSTEIQTENSFGEMVIDVIPVYDNPVNINSLRYDVSDGEMDEIEKALKVVKKKPVIKIKKKTAKPAEVLKLRRRVP